MTRALVTGTTGRLGGAFQALWENHPQFELQSLNRQDADLAQTDELATSLEKLEFDLLVNPAALSGLEQCLDHPTQADAINTRAPRVMAEICARKNARFIHFSTDYVFGGHHPGKKPESHPTAPINTYGKTKLAGEQAVMAAMPNAIIARVSWLFGPAPEHRLTHFDQALQSARSGQPASFINDKFSMPTYTHDVVSWVEQLLKTDKAAGIYHLCNTGNPESWHSYAKQACKIARTHGHDIPEVTFAAQSIQNASFFRDPRPIHTAMQPDRLIKECAIQPRHWLEAAAEYMEIH